MNSVFSLSCIISFADLRFLFMEHITYFLIINFLYKFLKNLMKIWLFKKTDFSSN